MPSQSQGQSIKFPSGFLAGEEIPLKQKEVNQLKVQLFQQISSKSLYADALTDPEVSKHLPIPDEVSEKHTEREFIFGILCTLKQQQMQNIIAEANKMSFRADDDGSKMDAISHQIHGSKGYKSTDTTILSTSDQLMCFEEKRTGKKVVKERNIFMLPKRLVTKSRRTMAPQWSQEDQIKANDLFLLHSSSDCWGSGPKGTS